MRFFNFSWRVTADQLRKAPNRDQWVPGLGWEATGHMLEGMIEEGPQLWRDAMYTPLSQLKSRRPDGSSLKLEREGNLVGRTCG